MILFIYLVLFLEQSGLNVTHKSISTWINPARLWRWSPLGFHPPTSPAGAAAESKAEKTADMDPDEYEYLERTTEEQATKPPPKDSRASNGSADRSDGKSSKRRRDGSPGDDREHSGRSRSGGGESHDRHKDRDRDREPRHRSGSRDERGHRSSSELRERDRERERERRSRSRSERRYSEHDGERSKERELRVRDREGRYCFCLCLFILLLLLYLALNFPSFFFW